MMDVPPPLTLMHTPLTVDRPAVLVVDDVLATRAGIVQLLELRGYRAVSAPDGASALDLMQRDPSIGLVILDLAMPQTDGYWLRAEQLKDPRLAAIPVIVFTGKTREVAGRALQGVEVLTKPLAVDRLFAAVERYCGWPA